ncbi:MAG TPA: hypothetical protein PKC30_11580 [Saprospiraceae bacterium]|nr:hypothetical protein [Saprospiraceae bacterium]
MSRTLYIIGFVLVHWGLKAQLTFQPKDVEYGLKGVVYQSEWLIDARLHTNGFAIAYNSGKIITFDKTNYVQIEVGVMGDPRERRQNRNLTFNRLGRSSSFVFGKENQMFVIRAGWGTRKYLSEKAKRQGVAIGYTYQAGPAVAILKPYYLNLIYRAEENGRQMTEIRNERLSDENRDKFLNYNDIFGGGGFSRGWGELSLTPGIQGKAAMVFSLGAFDEYAKALETGIMFDVFPRSLSIMAETENVSNKPYFINFYVNVQLGRRK